MSYKTCDLAAPSVDLRVDIQAMPLADAQFDLILCSHVLEHVRDDKAAMRELRRVCSPGGMVLIQVPLDGRPHTEEDLSDLPPSVRERRFGDVGHLRSYGADIVQALRTAGFDVTNFVANEIEPTIRNMAGLRPSETILVCSPTRSA